MKALEDETTMTCLGSTNSFGRATKSVYMAREETKLERQAGADYCWTCVRMLRSL